LRCSLYLHPFAPRSVGDAKVKGKEAKRTPSLRRVARIGVVEHLCCVTIHKIVLALMLQSLAALSAKAASLSRMGTPLHKYLKKNDAEIDGAKK
jgi:hypothetical protein